MMQMSIILGWGGGGRQALDTTPSFRHFTDILTCCKTVDTLTNATLASYLHHTAEAVDSIP